MAAASTNAGGNVTYECMRCSTPVTVEELSRLPEIKCICGNGIVSIATGHWTIEFHVVFSVVCKGIRKMTTYHTQGDGR